MGNIKFKEFEESSDSGKENYEYLNKKTYKEFCDFKFYREPYSKNHYVFLQTEYMIENQERAENEIIKLKEINNFENSVNLINYKFNKDKLFCIENLKINFFFQIENTNFSSLSEIWQKKRELISENKIWILIGDILNFLTDLKNLGFSHGDLKPQNIYITKDKVVKIFSPLIYTFIENGYKLMILNESYKTPISPELMFYYHNRERFPKYDKEKNDIFCMGISILCLLTNDDFNFFYDFCEGIIFHKRILVRLGEICEKLDFSSDFRLFLEKCLEKNLAKRGDLDELFRLLNKFRKSGSLKPWEF